MTNPRRDAPRRSILALPGSSARFLEKATTLPADALLIDLEDAVAPNAKRAARELIAHALITHDYGNRTVSVRVNSWPTRITLADLEAVITPGAARLDTITLPKTSSPAEVAALDLALFELEERAGLPPGRIGIDVLIENVAGLQSVEAIAGASTRLWSLGIGPGDLAASLHLRELTGGGTSPDYPGDHLHYVFMKVLAAGRAAGLAVFDGPYVRIDDQEGLGTLARRVAALGYDGKWAIHPDQIATLNEAFSPSEEEITRAERIIAALDEAEDERAEGAIRLDGEMLDEMSRKLARATLARRAPREGVR